MINRLRPGDNGSCFFFGAAAGVFGLLLALPAQAASADAETSPSPSVENRLAAIRTVTDPEIMVADNGQEPIDAAADEGFGPFISLNAGEELLAEIHFDSGSTQPTYIGKRKIEHVLNDLKALNPKQLRIVGFTDRTGSDAANQAISEARAESVADLLQERGLDIPVVIDPRGESNLLYPTPDGEAEPLNRCVGIIATR
ncbi:MAG: OmpA family protein [Geminicoccaceae bacterium]